MTEKERNLLVHASIGIKLLMQNIQTTSTETRELLVQHSKKLSGIINEVRWADVNFPLFEGFSPDMLEE